MIESYNYKKMFEHPIVVRKFFKWTSPIAIPVTWLCVFFVTLGIMAIFNNFFFAIGNLIPGATLLLFFGIPYGISTFLLKIKPDGKKLIFYLYDFAIYFFTIYLTGSKYINDQSVTDIYKGKVRFEDFYVKKERMEEDVVW